MSVVFAASCGIFSDKIKKNLHVSFSYLLTLFGVNVVVTGAGARNSNCNGCDDDGGSSGGGDNDDDDDDDNDDDDDSCCDGGGCDDNDGSGDASCGGNGGGDKKKPHVSLDFLKSCSKNR